MGLGACVLIVAINETTSKYQFPTLRLDDLLNQLHGAEVFSKIDLRSGYNHIKMRE